MALAFAGACVWQADPLDAASATSERVTIEPRPLTGGLQISAPLWATLLAGRREPCAMSGADLRAMRSDDARVALGRGTTHETTPRDAGIISGASSINVSEQHGWTCNSPEQAVGQANGSMPALKPHPQAVTQHGPLTPSVLKQCLNTGAIHGVMMSLDVTLTDASGAEVYSANITHNLGNMAKAAGIYACLWRPDENGITYAHQIIEPLAAGVALLAAEKARFEQFNAPNGWGLWKHFLPFCADYLQACRDHPDALASVSR